MKTKWIVEEFPCNFWDSLILALDQTNTEYKVLEIGNTDLLMERYPFDKGDCVFWYGPTNKLLNRVNTLPYWPGAICTEQNYRYEWLLNNYSDICLNKGAVLLPGKAAINYVRERLDKGLNTWVKPNSGMKTFESFKVYSEYSFGYTERIKDELVVCSEEKEVLGEWRIFLKDSKYITHARYRDTDSLELKQILEFVDKVKNYPKPDRLCVMDIASTKEGLFVCEFNAISSSGWYEDQDNIKLVEAINEVSLDIFNNV